MSYATVGWEVGEMVLDFGNEVQSGDSKVLVDRADVGDSFTLDLTWKLDQGSCLLEIQQASTDPKVPAQKKTVDDDGFFNGSPSHASFHQVDALFLTAQPGQTCKIHGAKDDFISIARRADPVNTPSAELSSTPVGAIVMVFRATGFFTPDHVTIHPGEKVIWLYADGANEPHSVTSGACRVNDCTGGGQEFDSGPTLIKPGQRFEHVFAKTGTFPYHCDLHLGSMQGTIIVKP